MANGAIPTYMNRVGGQNVMTTTPPVLTKAEQQAAAAETAQWNADQAARLQQSKDRAAAQRAAQAAAPTAPAPAAQAPTPAAPASPAQTTFSYGPNKDARYAADPLNAPRLWQDQHQDQVSSAKAAEAQRLAKTPTVNSSSVAQPAVQAAQVVDWNVKPEETVESRMKGLLDPNNPLTQLSKTQGLQDAASRGMLNSSMAAEAGVLAAYKNSLPIAQQDAQTYASAGSQNAQLGTNINQFNADSVNKRNNLYYTTETSAGIDRENMANQMQLARLNADTSRYNTNVAAQTAGNRLAFDNQEAARLDRLDRDKIASNQQFALDQLDRTGKLDMARLDRSAELNLTGALKQNYLAAVNNIGNITQQQITAIQSSAIPEEAKAAQIENAQIAGNNNLALNNAAYSALPEFKREWAIVLQEG